MLSPAPTPALLVPGDWSVPTGGNRYAQRLAAALSEAGWPVEHRALAKGFPWPDADALAQAEAVVDTLRDGTLTIVDGLAFGALPSLARRHAVRLRWVALLHHPLHLESGLDEAQRQHLREQEREALRWARSVVVTSATTARDVAATLDVPMARIRVVEPGTDRAPEPPLASKRAHGPATPLRLLCVASLTPRKGHATLLQALAPLRGRPWTLDCVGSATRDPATAAALATQAEALGIAAQLQWHGEVDEATLEAHYARADVCLQPSLHEGYGMAVAEALARGLPVLASDGGALAETLPDDAGWRVPAGDAAALGLALERVLEDPALREAAAAGARRAARRLPTWDDAAHRFAAAIADRPTRGALATQARSEGAFSAEWLAQREPHDRAARDAAARELDLDAVFAGWRRQHGPAPLTVVDLGCGTGANLRALASRLGGAQHWRVVDHDATLLDRWPDLLHAWATAQGGRSVEVGEVAGGLPPLRVTLPTCQLQVERIALDFGRTPEALPLQGAALVTASALLDLVSHAWLQRLVSACAAARAAAFFSLNVDGRLAWTPADADDGAVEALFRAHQRRDKGFGFALGPGAPTAAALALAAAGYTVRQATSDWGLDARDTAAEATAAAGLIASLIDGMADAAGAQAPALAALVQAWRARRQALLAVSTLRVGHVDLLAGLRDAGR